MKNKHFWPLVIIGSLLVAIIFSSSHNFAAILGTATGFILFPGIILLVIVGIMRLFKKKLSDGKFNDTFLILWGAMLGLFILGNLMV